MDVKFSLSDNDEAIILWAEMPSMPNGSFYKSEYRNGSWQHPTSASDRVNASTNNAFLIDLAFNKNGDAIALWMEDGTDIYRWHYRNGSWGSKVLVTTNGALSIPTVKMNEAGHAIIAWADSTGLFVSEFNGTSWSAANELTAGDSSSFTDTAEVFLELSNNGNVVLGFLKDVGMERLVYRAYQASGVWSTPADVTDTVTTGGMDSRQLSVAISPSGRAAIYWLEGNLAGESYLYTQIYNGTSWGAKTLLDSDLVQYLDVRKIAINDLGQVVASYTSQATFTTKLKFYNGSSWSSMLDSGDADIYRLDILNNQAEILFITAAESVVRRTCSSSGCGSPSVVISRDGADPNFIMRVPMIVAKNSQRTIYIWQYNGDYSTRGLEVFSGTNYLIDPIL